MTPASVSPPNDAISAGPYGTMRGAMQAYVQAVKEGRFPVDAIHA